MLRARNSNIHCTCGEARNSDILALKSRDSNELTQKPRNYSWFRPQIERVSLSSPHPEIPGIWANRIRKGIIIVNVRRTFQFSRFEPPSPNGNIRKKCALRDYLLNATVCFSFRIFHL